MSKIGRKPVPINPGVTVELKGSELFVRGQKGELSVAIPSQLSVTIKDNELTVTPNVKTKESASLHGMARNIIQNAVTGVSDGFTRKLEMKGTGYRAEVKEGSLTLIVGFSHPVAMTIPQGITAAVERNVVIILAGSDRQKLGHFAAQIRAVRPPEPYKGKGIKYEQEIIKRKPGKAAKAAQAGS
ncbi:MAG: 50S ribosomal protein L6 [Patescibacteria group bacterium]